jgi:hypothetical protein
VKKLFLSLINKPYWSFVGTILAAFAFFGISSENFLESFSKYAWMIDATKWSLIIGAFIFAVHAYIRAEKNRKKLTNIKSSAFDEAYKHFTNQLNYALGRYRGFSSNLAPDKEKYTEVGVWERLNEVKSARMQLLSVCGEHVRAILLEAGTDWLEDMELFGETAPSIIERLSSTAFKDRN